MIIEKTTRNIWKITTIMMYQSLTQHFLPDSKSAIILVNKLFADRENEKITR